MRPQSARVGHLRTAGEVESPYARGLPYAPGLDGIRALAVGGVLLYHARVSWLPGGFLGVDLFFVLSGYLITALLLAEHRRCGRIDLPRFWAGRARRLLPAAILVIAVCLMVVAVFLPDDLDTLRADALTAVLYVNNWHQILGAHSYFAAFGRPSLLQHYWSLAVEEQFYLLWPLLLAGGLAVFRRPWLATGAIVAVASSAGLMALLYHPGIDPSRVYYGTDTRATPLMIGAILAFAWPLGRLTAPASRDAALVLDAIGVAGLAVVALAMLGWHDYDSFLYRGGFVVVAVAAAALLAAAGHPASHLGRGPTALDRTTQLRHLPVALAGDGAHSSRDRSEQTGGRRAPIPVCCTTALIPIRPGQPSMPALLRGLSRGGAIGRAPTSAAARAAYP